MPGHRAYRAWFVIAAVVSLEVLLGRDRTVVDYDGGDNEARALFFCMNHGVGEDENCVERLVLAARERNETGQSSPQVRKEEGPFVVLKDYPEIENEWGFAQPDPRVLPVCVGEVESTGKRPLQFSEDHVADL
ncbi:unnamed protein product, partial [Pelagomonas calceolata]